jgi:hypothetical protein
MRRFYEAEEPGRLGFEPLNICELRNGEGVRSMKSIAALAVVFLGALVVVMAQAGPTYAQQTTVAVTSAGPAVDSVVGAESTVPVQLIKRGGGLRTFRASGMRSSNFVRHHRLRPFLFSGIYGASLYGGYYAGCGEGCYQEGNKTCVWNGYNYRCYVTGDEIY